MKSLFAILSLLLLFASCQAPSQERKFSKQGVSFTIPTGWKGVDEEDLGGGYSISIEKEGFDASGLVTMTWVDMEIELEDWAAEFKEEMISNWNTAASSASFSGVKNGKYNGIPTRTLTYKMTLVGMKHDGTIHLFYRGGKSFAIIIQEAIEDRKDNKEGFKTIESSFKVV